MAFYKIKSGRVNGQITSSQYIGNSGSIFYDDSDGELRLSDGVTPGGVAISVRADLIVAPVSYTHLTLPTKRIV